MHSSTRQSMVSNPTVSHIIYFKNNYPFYAHTINARNSAGGGGGGGAVLLTVGRSYVGNDVTHSTCSYENLPKYRSYRVSNTAPWTTQAFDHHVLPIVLLLHCPRYYNWIYSGMSKLCGRPGMSLCGKCSKLFWLLKKSPLFCFTIHCPAWAYL